MSFLEESWKEREEKLYKSIFGDTGPGIYPLSSETFERMSEDSIDPRWLTHGVCKCPPNANRKTWAYVTSGMSNPWESDAPEDYSGLGVEFVMETDEEAGWPIGVLHSLMAYNLLIAAGKMGNSPPLYYGHRIPLALSESVRTMMLTYPINFPESFVIKSGKVSLIQVVGITEAELEVAKSTSSDDLKLKIVANTGDLVTRMARESVV